MFPILIGAGALALYQNTRPNDKLKVRSPTQEERATMEYGINTVLDQNNDYLFTGQKSLQTRDQYLRPYGSYGEAVDRYNQRFENKSRLVHHLIKVRNPSFTVPSDHDTPVRFNLITPFVLDPEYHASPPKPLNVHYSNGWY